MTDEHKECIGQFCLNKLKKFKIIFDKLTKN